MPDGLMLESPGDLPPEASRRSPRSSRSDRTRPTAEGGEVDLGRDLTQELHQFHPVGGTGHRRPFDAQYWACWVVAVVAPSLTAYLIWIR